MRAKTPIRLLGFFALLLCAPLPALAATDVSDDITTDTEWTLAGSPYVVNFDNEIFFPRVLTVSSGATLTIDPGVVVKFGTYNGLTVEGTLHADGTADNPITFTSLQDDTAGGDTNGDGSSTTPTDEQWMHLQFNTGSTGTFDHAVVRYGGAHAIFTVPNTGIQNNGGTILIDHTTLTNNGFDGLGHRKGHTTLRNSEISNHQVGINMERGTLEIHDTHVHHNLEEGIRHRSADGVLTIDHSEIDHNGTGILATDHGSITVTNSSIHDNTLEGSGFGIDNQTQVIGYDENDEPFVQDPGITIDARNNWWGSPSEPSDRVSGDVLYEPWLISDPLAAVPPSGASSVLFLPGIEASRLYKPDYNGGTDQLWEPNADSDVQDLFMDPDGSSVRNDIYTRDVVDEAHGTRNIYKSFLADLDAWKNDDVITDYTAVPYDWRLFMDDVLDNGNQFPDGRTYYSGDLSATSSPYILQELRRLAQGSKTGKVTLVAHSNGGLVVKALTEKLGSEASTLIDKIIFVAVPQVGTPQAIGAILHGYDQGLPFDWAPLLLTPETARTFAENMPSAYNLLPSANYFSQVDDPAVTFDDSNILAEFRARYGSSIHDGTQLNNFITDSRRLASSSPSDLAYPSVGNAGLLSHAETLHSTIDEWTPPSGVDLYEVAGWGEDTLAAIEYKEGKKTYCSDPRDINTCTDVPAIMFNPKEVVEGDGTVLVPSALWTPVATGVTKYWVNLDKYNNKLPQSLSHLDSKHAHILEVPELRTLISNILTSTTSIQFEFLSTVQPATDANANKRLRFVLHSPLNLSAVDNIGNIVNHATSTIPGSRFKRYGEVQVITVPKDTPITLNLDGYATGSFTLDMQEIDGNNSVIASSTFSAVPSATSTAATMTFTDGTIENASPLLLDYDGNGTTDFSLTSEVGETAVFDITPPEATLAFDPAGQRLKLIGTDNLSTPTVSITAAGTTITDDAGNTLQVTFKKAKQEEKKIKIEIQGLSYNGVSAGRLPKAVLEYKWSIDKTGKLKEFEEKVVVGPLEVEGHYDAKKNVTKIGKKTLPGLVIIGIKTEKGIISIDY